MPKKTTGSGKKVATIVPLHEESILKNLENKENVSAYLLNLLRLDAMFDIENILKSLVNKSEYTVIKKDLQMNQKNANIELEEEIGKSEFENLNELEEDDLL
jgi:hypothetical protein